MTLEDFEKQLARDQKSEKSHEKRKDRESRSEGSEHRRHHHHHRHHKSSRDRDRDHPDEHRSKRRRHEDDTQDDQDKRRRHRRKSSTEEERVGVEKIQDLRPDANNLKRDSWMEAPSSIDVDYVHRKRKEPSPPKYASLGSDLLAKVHDKELNHHLRDLKSGKATEEIREEQADHEVDYTFGDSGSQWRMTKLRAVHRQAEETARPIEECALERYDSLREFDDAREEEIELERRKTYGKDYVGKDKPNGDLFQERKQKAGVRRVAHRVEDDTDSGQLMTNVVAPAKDQNKNTTKVDQTALNKMKAQIMRAQLRKDPNLTQLQKEYDEAMAATDTQDPTVVTLSAMDNRMLSSAPRNEVRSVSNRRGAERGQVEENEDISIEDMVREERRSRHQKGGESQRFAERIAKDGKFDNDLEYMDENAMKLAKRVHKSDMNLRNIAIGEYQKMNKILENCPLCHHEDTETPPIAPVVSLGTRTYLTLPTEPELASLGAMIVPIEHKVNLLEADDDEWEEIRNFMKSLTRFYHDQGRDVIFYENAAHPHRKPHAALTAVPLPYSLGETAPAFFQEAFLTTESEWSQHKKIIDTLAKSKQGLGKLAFRRTLAKEMPYFHVWFEMDGGYGHIVEDAEQWPKGDLFAREIVGGMLGSEPDVIKRQGRWQRGQDHRLEGFRKKWHKFDWTRVLTSE